THSWQLGTAQVTGTLRARGALGGTTSPEGAMFAERDTSSVPASRTAVYATATDNSTLHADAVTLTSNPATSRTEPNGVPGSYIALRPAQQPLLPCIVTNGLYPVSPN